ncbi:M24 family metallopeptidase [Planctomycetes bacterium K23_9]|uniref:Putative peptidase n=1 Tax=Stieleria marina TaxID=1930275 RepID=A0A517NX31_9BACT|nr:putative peptidase [Planctomycetes bacterium K23_9]
MAHKILAGFAISNASLFRRLGVPLGDPAAWLEIDDEKIALVRDLEMDRVRSKSQADSVTCPARHEPMSGLSADRETATAQAAAELFRSRDVSLVVADRTLPYIFAWHLQQAGITVQYDDELGVLDRRTKSEQEIEYLAKAQAITEDVMKLMCETIAGANVTGSGQLQIGGQPLTSERIKAMAAIEFLNRGCTTGHGAIVATAPHVADCHHSGEGVLKTSVPVIVDLFPRDESTRYWGDCTRTVVHGEPSDVVKAMHAAVVAAKAASTAALTAGNLAGDIHKAGEDVLIEAGYPVSRGELTDQPSIQHGTGHGIGLDLHEPILLDHGGGKVLAGEVFTVEPGLYGRKVGGVRIEDMLVVTDGEARNINQLHDGLDWTT